MKMLVNRRNASSCTSLGSKMSVHPNPRYHPSSVLLKSDPNSFSSEGVPLKQSLSRSLLLSVRYTSDPSAKITSKLNHEDFLVNRGPSSRHFSNNDKNPWWSKKPLPPPAPVNSMFSESRYKTVWKRVGFVIHFFNYALIVLWQELCRQFDEIGDCEYGDRCLFAHGFEELKAPNNRHPKFKTER